MAENASLRYRRSYAIAGALKLSPLFMLAFFFARGAWKALIWSLGASVLFAIIPLVFISPQIFSQFSVALGNFDASVVPLAHNESLVGLFIQIANLLHIAPAVGELAAQGLAGMLAVVGVGRC